LTNVRRRLVLIAVAIGIAVSVWVVRAGGPSDHLTRTWVFGLHALAVGVVAAEIITRIAGRR
jgi:hypothetical protein